MHINRFAVAALLTALTLGLNAETTSTYLLGGWTFQKKGESTSRTVTIPHDWAVAGPFDKEVDKQVVRVSTCKRNLSINLYLGAAYPQNRFKNFEHRLHLFMVKPRKIVPQVSCRL